MIMNDIQCETLVNNTCGLYGSTCKTLCSAIDDEDICENIRSDDCFWLIESENHLSDPNTHCIDKVCLIWVYICVCACIYF
jgi:hypothetical protein